MAGVSHVISPLYRRTTLVSTGPEKSSSALTEREYRESLLTPHWSVERHQWKKNMCVCVNVRAYLLYSTRSGLHTRLLGMRITSRPSYSSLLHFRWASCHVCLIQRYAINTWFLSSYTHTHRHTQRWARDVEFQCTTQSESSESLFTLKFT